jgi:hypothetical protein
MMTTMTLSDAVKSWGETKKLGGYCPCCDRWGKIYRVKISETMARSLLWMAKNHGTDWVDMPAKAPRWITRSNSFGKLRYWGLLAPMPIDSHIEDGQELKSSGYWMVTQSGLQFAKGMARVPQYVYVYDNTIEGTSDKDIVLSDCIGKKFNYAELMQATWGDDD